MESNGMEKKCRGKEDKLENGMEWNMKSNKFVSINCAYLL